MGCPAYYIIIFYSRQRKRKRKEGVTLKTINNRRRHACAILYASRLFHNHEKSMTQNEQNTSTKTNIFYNENIFQHNTHFNNCHRCLTKLSYLFIHYPSNLSIRFLIIFMIPLLFAQCVIFVNVSLQLSTPIIDIR
jgi:hypothetical protein